MQFESVADVAAVHIQLADGVAVLAISPCNVDSVHIKFRVDSLEFRVGYPSAGNIRMQLVVPRAVSAAEMAATIIRRITSHVDLLSFIVFLFFKYLDLYPDLCWI